MDYIYAKFHQILTILHVDAYYGALHDSLRDWVLNPVLGLLAIYIVWNKHSGHDMIRFEVHSLN